MMRHLSLLALLLCLLPLAVTAQDGVEKFGQRMRLVQRSQRGGYRLCKPMRGRGFCIVGEGQNEGVVLGYSTDGDLERALESPLFVSLLRCYDEPGAVQTRPRLLPGGVKPSVDPLLTDTWDQPEPYNICAPMIDGQHCQVGCVALALAQVMHYWRWPNRGVGSHTYIDSTGCGLVLTADFAHEYRWDLMRDVYEGEVDSTDAGLLAAGQLFRDCGIAVDMRYGLHASGARSVRQPIALCRWFGYDAGVQLHFRDFFSRQEWEEMLMRELSAGRPVLFSAQSNTLSHALVCDGYDEDGLFHMNMGLGGDANGFYYLPHFTPKQPEWYDPDRAEGGLNLLQYMSVGVQPATPSPVVRHSLGMASIEPVQAQAGRSGEVSVCTSHLANVGWNETDEGAVQLVLLAGDSVLCPLATYPHAFSLEELTDTSYTDTLSLAIPSSVGSGLYRVCPAVLEPQGDWTLARASMGTPSHVLLRVTQDSLSLVPDKSAQASLELLSWQFPDSVYRYQRPSFSFSLRNKGASEYCGRLVVMLREVADTTRCHVVCRQGVWLSAGEEVSFDFSRTAVSVPVGDYELCLAYDCNLFTDSLVWLSPSPLLSVQVHPYISSVVEGVDGVEESHPRRYALDGLPWRNGQRGVAVERWKGKRRKIVTR